MIRRFSFVTVLLILALIVAGCSGGLPFWPQTGSTSDGTASSYVTPAPVIAVEATPASVAEVSSTTTETVPATATPGLVVASPTPASAVVANVAQAAPVAIDTSAQVALAAMEAAFESIYTQMNPSVVLINVVSQATSFGFPFGGQQGTEQALGSGFVWDKNGHIVTNNHVVEGATSIVVTFSDGSSTPATLVGADPDSDLAVIKVNVSADRLQPVTLADSTKVKVGQIVIAIGNPFGEQNTMTTGIISALGRTLPAGSSDNTIGPNYTIPDVIQTDAAINPGNSGGVLLDTQAHVIGVTSAIESPVQASAGIGFVIPSAIVQRVIPALIQTGHFEHPWLGITGMSLTPDLASAMNLNPEQRGALVVDVIANSPAAQGGLKASTKSATVSGAQTQVGGDVIIALDGQPIKTFDDVSAYLAANTVVGQTVMVTVVRDSKAQDATVILQARPSSAQTSAQSQFAEGAYLGATGITVTPEIARAMSLPSDVQGVLVQQVITDSPADQAGLQAGAESMTINGTTLMIGGDIIIGFGNQSVTSVDDLNSLLQQSQPGQRVTLTIVRDGREGRVRVILDQPPTSELQPSRFAR